MREKLKRFMIGRYGLDELSKFILYVMAALCIISFFIKSSILTLLLFFLLFLNYARMFSKNYPRRYEENRKFLLLKERMRCFFKREKNVINQRKTVRIYTCPSCRQKIRIPKGKGKVCVTCPKCRTEFIKRS